MGRWGWKKEDRISSPNPEPRTPNDMRLQTQLTLSHLAVTAISVVVLLLGGLFGYSWYLRSAWPAQWAADNAVFYAEEVAQWDEPLNVAAEIVVEDYFFPVWVDQAREDDWLIVTDLNGVVAGSNFPERYRAGKQIVDNPPPGFDVAVLTSAENIAYFNNINHRYIGYTPIVTEDGEWLGWLYYHSGVGENQFQLQRTGQFALITAGTLALISLLVSGVMGYWLARGFGRKLDTLASASAAFASGDRTRRIETDGSDEIAQLGQQFNQMAATIDGQMRDLSDLAQANGQLAESNAQLALEAEGLARLEERNRLARELHDAIKQQLFGMNLTLGSVQPLLETKPELAKQRIGHVVEQTQAVQVELDQIINQLRPASLEDKGLPIAVQALADQWAEQTGVAVQVEMSESRPLSLAVEQAVYRVIQESLQNIGKHAQAQSVKIALRYAVESLALEIVDDGVGFDMTSAASTGSGQAEAGHGLYNMRDRIHALDGTFDVFSQLNVGTQIAATVPLTRVQI